LTSRAWAKPSGSAVLFLITNRAAACVTIESSGFFALDKEADAALRQNSRERAPFKPSLGLSGAVASGRPRHEAVESWQRRNRFWVEQAFRPAWTCLRMFGFSR